MLNSLRNFFIKLISTFFFIGYLPLIPGTFGSLAGVGVFYLLGASSGLVYFLVLLGIIILGGLTSNATEKILQKKDPGCIVIDEVAGMLVALSFMPLNFKVIILGFLIFRILDTLKPYPADKIQLAHGSIGVMGDDLVAGLYTNLVLSVIVKFI